MYQINHQKMAGQVETPVFEIMIDDAGMNSRIVEEIEKQGDRQGGRSNVKAQMTEWNMIDRPGFQELARHMVMAAAMVSQSHFNQTIKPRIINIWGMKYRSGEETTTHDHWPSTWSCAYYIDPPPGCPGLYFPQFQREIEPRNGLLVLFEGWVRHEVRKLAFGGVRYAVSANLMAT